jgi:hypothetical protein
MCETFSDVLRAAERVAMEIIELPPGPRNDAITKIRRVLFHGRVAWGSTETVAASNYRLAHVDLATPRPNL